jgi:anti-sigma regulatory factor (Ser/Thr protein kinase)
MSNVNNEANGVRLLPWTGAHGQPCLLLTDGDGTASRLADRIEDVQLGLASRLLERTREMLSAREVTTIELALLTAQLADALDDVLRIADSRSARIGAGPQALAAGGGSAPPSAFVLHDVHGVLAHGPATPRSFGLLILPGRDRASARIARRYVRDTAQAWGLAPGTTNDLESVASELVANAVEHSGSSAVTIATVLTSTSATISVTDEGRNRASAIPPSSAVPPPVEQEHGRGLLITDALADRWGTRRAGGGTTVWAEVRLGGRER